MQVKLTVNKNHYSTEITYIDYVLSQLSKKAAQHTESYSLYKFSVINLYCTVNKILKNLKKIYKDLDKSRNYC